jgi:hypothetical protein
MAGAAGVGGGASVGAGVVTVVGVVGGGVAFVEPPHAARRASRSEAARRLGMRVGVGRSRFIMIVGTSGVACERRVQAPRR